MTAALLMGLVAGLTTTAAYIWLASTSILLALLAPVAFLAFGSAAWRFVRKK